MQALLQNLQKFEFEARIFVSLGIVAIVFCLSIGYFVHVPSLLLLLGIIAGISEEAAQTIGFVFVAIVMAGVSIFRMWAGSLLTPHRVMAFRVQVDELRTAGPYRIVRNPIYLADFVAICSIAACLPVIGMLLPVLFCMHYLSIIRYEEVSLRARFGHEYEEYVARVPRLMPGARSVRNIPASLKEFKITRAGARHNALFVLFVPGLLLAAVSHEFLIAVIVGIPAVIDWAVVHTRIGAKRSSGGTIS